MLVSRVGSSPFVGGLLVNNLIIPANGIPLVNTNPPLNNLFLSRVKIANAAQIIAPSPSVPFEDIFQLLLLCL